MHDTGAPERQQLLITGSMPTLGRWCGGCGVMSLSSPSVGRGANKDISDLLVF